MNGLDCDMEVIYFRCRLPLVKYRRLISWIFIGCRPVWQVSYWCNFLSFTGERESERWAVSISLTSSLSTNRFAMIKIENMLKTFLRSFSNLEIITIMILYPLNESGTCFGGFLIFDCHSPKIDILDRHSINWSPKIRKSVPFSPTDLPPHPNLGIKQIFAKQKGRLYLPTSSRHPDGAPTRLFGCLSPTS